MDVLHHTSVGAFTDLPLQIGTYARYITRAYWDVTFEDT